MNASRAWIELCCDNSDRDLDCIAQFQIANPAEQRLAEVEDLFSETSSIPDVVQRAFPLLSLIAVTVTWADRMDPSLRRHRLSGLIVRSENASHNLCS